METLFVMFMLTVLFLMLAINVASYLWGVFVVYRAKERARDEAREQFNEGDVP